MLLAGLKDVGATGGLKELQLLCDFWHYPTAINDDPFLQSGICFIALLFNLHDSYMTADPSQFSFQEYHLQNTMSAKKLHKCVGQNFLVRC